MKIINTLLSWFSPKPKVESPEDRLKLIESLPTYIPTVSRSDVDRIIARDFRPEEAQLVWSILNEYGTEKWHYPPHDRVWLAILKLANGDIGQLRQHVAVAREDFRDVILPAESPRVWKDHRCYDVLPENQLRALLLSDWQQYENWLNSPTKTTSRPS